MSTIKKGFFPNSKTNAKNAGTMADKFIKKGYKGKKTAPKDTDKDGM
jgi:hypothetical protein